MSDAHAYTWVAKVDALSAEHKFSVRRYERTLILAEHQRYVVADVLEQLQVAKRMAAEESSSPVEEMS